LHYALVGGDFLLASEIKALLVHPSVGRGLDLQALAQYLAYEYVPNPLTIFREIKKLPPAHRMTYDLRTRQLRLTRYWDLSFRPDPGQDEHSAADELVSRLREAVRRRLLSEVPLGVFLSGGVDSSAVVALMTE